MATEKEIAVARLKELSGLLGRELETEGTLAELRQRVREAETELEAKDEDGENTPENSPELQINQPSDEITAAVNANAPPEPITATQLKEKLRLMDEEEELENNGANKGPYCSVKMLKTAHTQVFEAGQFKNEIAVEGKTYQMKTTEAVTLEKQGFLTII